MKKSICILLLAVIMMTVLGTGCQKEKQTDTKQAVGADYTKGKLLKDRLQVPETVQGVFSSESGETNVYVDAKVVVPEVSRVDVIEALPRVYTDEDVLDFYERHHEGLDWQYAETGEPYDGAAPTFDEELDHYDLFIVHEPESEENYNEEMRWFNVSYGMDAKGRPEFLLDFEYRRNYVRCAQLGFECIPLEEDGKAKDCTISLEEAIRYADEEVHAMLPDYELTWYGQTRESDIGVPGTSLEVGSYYHLKYSRHLNGIPINVSDSNVDCSNEYGYTAGIGVVSVMVDDTGVIGVRYQNPYNVGEILEEDVELLSWDEVMDIYSTISVLSIQDLEAYEEVYQNDLNVYEIRFGYMAVLQADNTYQYTPVWDFYARRILKGEGAWAGSSDLPPNEGDSWLTINAIDGTIIDRSLGY